MKIPKACPWCGAPAAIYTFPGGGIVTCSKHCKWSKHFGPIMWRSGAPYPPRTKDQAIMDWNVNNDVVSVRMKMEELKGAGEDV